MARLGDAATGVSRWSVTQATVAILAIVGTLIPPAGCAAVPSSNFASQTSLPTKITMAPSPNTEALQKASVPNSVQPPDVPSPENVLINVNADAGIQPTDVTTRPADDEDHRNPLTTQSNSTDQIEKVQSWIVDVNTSTSWDKHPNAAGNGSDVYVTIVNPEAYVRWATGKGLKMKPPSPIAVEGAAFPLPPQDLDHLQLFVDGQPVLGLYKTGEDVVSTVIVNDAFRAEQRVMRFHLEPGTAKSGWPRGFPENWSPSHNTDRRAFVSIGFNNFPPVILKGKAALNNSKVDFVPRWQRVSDDSIPQNTFSLDCWVDKVVRIGVDGHTNAVEKARLENLGGLDDDLCVYLVNPDAYFQWAASRGGNRGKAPDLSDLVLYIDNRPIPGLHPLANPREEELFYENFGHEFLAPVYPLQFHLTRGKESNVAWAALLNRPSRTRPVSISVGFEDLAPLDTAVIDATSFQLRVIPTGGWTMAGMLVIVASLLGFLWLAATTNLIRDTAADPKPDGRRPFSLARTQMAFWSFLVVSTFFFIYVVTRDIDTIPAGVLGLIGVSAVTAVASAWKDTSNRGGKLTIPVTRTVFDKAAEVELLMSEKKSLQTSAAAAVATPIVVGVLAAPKAAPIARAPAAGDPMVAAPVIPAPAAPDATVAARPSVDKNDRLKEIDLALNYFLRPGWQNFLIDLLSESDPTVGEYNSVSFYRFQMFMWTIVLGVIFIKEVYERLAMPDFNSTLIGLMGISAGTFVALKGPNGPKNPKDTAIGGAS